MILTREKANCEEYATGCATKHLYRVRRKRMNEFNTVLVIDDDELNLEIIEDTLTDEGFNVISAVNGREGLSILQAKGKSISVILLDWMMPEMSGIAVLNRIKRNEEWKDIPVIMETAKANTPDIIIGISGGAYYYLTKPFDIDLLVTIVTTAAKEYEAFRTLSERKPTQEQQQAQNLKNKGVYRFRTAEEGVQIILELSQLWDASSLAIHGLRELVANAVEHGNLGIGYERKTELIKEGTLEEEIAAMLRAPENKEKRVTLTYEVAVDKVVITIEDEGEGFDYSPYLDFHPARIFEAHGRGIAMAKNVFLLSMTYVQPGNKVIVTIPRGEAGKSGHK